MYKHGYAAIPSAFSPEPCTSADQKAGRRTEVILPPDGQIALLIDMPSGSDTSSVEDKLDLLIALIRIAHRRPLDTEREAIFADGVSKAVLAVTGRDWIDAGDLKVKAIAKTKASKPTVERRIAELLARGALKRDGAGGHVRYRSTGLFDV